MQAVREAHRVRQESVEVPGLSRGCAPGMQEAAAAVQVRNVQFAQQQAGCGFEEEHRGVSAQRGEPADSSHRLPHRAGDREEGNEGSRPVQV